MRIDSNSTSSQTLYGSCGKGEGKGHMSIKNQNGKMLWENEVRIGKFEVIAEVKVCLQRPSQRSVYSMKAITGIQVLHNWQKINGHLPFSFQYKLQKYSTPIIITVLSLRAVPYLV